MNSKSLLNENLSYTELIAKIVIGGRNGYGAKLCNIFSKTFTLETSTNEYGKAFKQVFKYFFRFSHCSIDILGLRLNFIS